MKKEISIELLGDRQLGGVHSIDTAVPSAELLANNNFTSGASGSSPLDPSNYATDWDFAYQTGSGVRSWTWNSAGQIEKVVGTHASKFSQVMTLGPGVAYTLEVKFKEYNRCGSLAVTAHGMMADGSSVPGANIILCDPSNVPQQGFGFQGNPNVGYGGGRPNNSTGTTSGGGWHTTHAVWRQANNISKVRFTMHMENCSAIIIDYLKLSRMDMNQSLIVGRLDGANPEDSPLSLNYAINSATNIEARAGAYSKTFQIPATANNNKVLKNMNITNSTHNDAGLRFQTPCRISAGGVFAVEGLFKVQDVIRIKNKAVAYSCVFFGDNLGWSTLLENKKLNEIEFPNSTGLKVCAREIIATWAQDNAAEVTEYDGTTSENTSPLVYPFATYGPTNETGGLWADKSMQLLREYWEVYSPTTPTSETACYFYDASHLLDTTPLPVVDWRPMLWVYTLYKAIFKNIGYRIESQFIESLDFKKLLYATPNANYQNPDERYILYSCTNDYNSAATLNSTNISYEKPGQSIVTQAWPNPLPSPLEIFGYFEYNSPTILSSASRFQTTLANDTTITHGGTFSWITIGEAGYYKLELKNFTWGFTGATWSGSGGPNTRIRFGPGIGWQVQTIGKATWDTVIVDTGSISSQNALVKNVGYSNLKYVMPMNDSSFEGYFNKGDKLRIFIRVDWKMIGDGVSSGATTTLSNCTWRIYGTEFDGVAGGVSSSNGKINVTLLNPSRLEYAQTYDLANIIPADHQQLDFVKGIAHAFNLQFQTDEKTKTVYIEPFSEFYKPIREAIDWTAKLDRSKEITDAWIDSNFTRRLIFKYKSDDSDEMVKALGISHFQGVQDYEPYIENLNSAYPVGDTIFENPFFAGTYDVMKFNTGGITTGGNNFYSAALWNTIGGTVEKGYDFAPRLLMYDKKDYGIQNLTDMDGNYVNYNTGRNWKGQYWEDMDTKNFYSAWVGWADTTITQTPGFFPPAPWYGGNPPYLPFGYNWAHAFVPQCTFIDRFNFTNQFGLSYGNYTCQDYEFDGNLNGGIGGQSYGPIGTGVGLYHRYYKVMIDNLIDQPKLRTAYIDLRVSDILNLDFSKPIYIDGIYYKLIKIIDYQPHFDTSTQVELHQYTPEKGAGIPQAPQMISTGTVAGGSWDDGGWAPAPVGPQPM